MKDLAILEAESEDKSKNVNEDEYFIIIQWFIQWLLFFYYLLCILINLSKSVLN